MADLPPAHSSHIWPFMPTRDSICERCWIRRGDREVALRCISDGPLYQDDPAAARPCDTEAPIDGD